MRSSFPLEPKMGCSGQLAELVKARSLEARSEPGFDYWMVFRQGKPQWAFERITGRVWTHGRTQSADLMKLYDKSGSRRELNGTVVAAISGYCSQLDGVI